MTTARDIMHPRAECIGEHMTLAEAAQKMLTLDIGALPICGDDDRLVGMITEADLARHLPDAVVGRFVEEICAVN